MELVFDRRGAGRAHAAGGSVLVLLHGIGSRWQVFEPVLGALAERFEVWSLDMPGFGASPAPPRAPRSIADLTDSVAGWLAAQGIEGAHVAGNSTGGGVALELASRGLVSSAVALAPIGFWSARERAYCQASVTNARNLSRRLRPAAPRLFASASGRRAFFWQFAQHGERYSPSEALGSVDALIGAPSFDDVCAAFTGYLAPADAADRVPVTIAWGAKDRLLLPRQLARARTRIPKARLALLPDAGHLMMGDDPEGVAALIAAGSGV